MEVPTRDRRRVLAGNIVHGGALLLTAAGASWLAQEAQRDSPNYDDILSVNCTDSNAQHEQTWLFPVGNFEQTVLLQVNGVDTLLRASRSDNEVLAAGQAEPLEPEDVGKVIMEFSEGAVLIAGHPVDAKGEGLMLGDEGLSLICQEPTS